MSNTTPDASAPEDSASTDTAAADKAARRQRIGDLITYGGGLVRGLSTLGIAVLLIFVPERSAPMLANKMGFFWLFSSIALLKLNRDNPTRQHLGTRTTTIIAIVGILTGLLMVTRNFSEKFVAEATLGTLLGVVIAVTGLLHVWSEFKVGGTVTQAHRLLHGLLGIFEIVLGLLLVVSPLDRSPFTYWIATIWALVFGVIAIGETVAQWLHDRKTKKKATAESDASSSPAA